MQVPNWKHHSNKEQKRKLKPQALRSAKERRRHLIKSLLKTYDSRRFFNINTSKVIVKNGSSSF